MTFLRIMLIGGIFANSLSAMQQAQTSENDFKRLWPFQKLGTHYDEEFTKLAPVFYRNGNVFATKAALEEAKKYINDPKSHVVLLPEEKNALDACPRKQRVMRVINHVLMPTTSWKNQWVKGEGTCRERAIIAFHGLGDTAENFTEYVNMLDSNAALFVPDFHDRWQDKPWNIGTQLELLMAAYQYFSAKQQLNAHYQFSAKKPIEYLLGVSRGGGIVARLMSKFKEGQEPNGGFIMLAPFINPGATIGRVASESSYQSSGFSVGLPDWLYNLGLHSANVISENTVEIDPSIPLIVRVKQPLLIIHGSKDQTIPHEISEAWAREHAKAGNEVYYQTVPNVDHIGLFDSQACMHLTRAFLRKDSREWHAACESLECLRLK